MIATITFIPPLILPSGLHLTAGTQYIFAVDPSGSFNGTYFGSETNGEPCFFVNYTPS